MKIKYIASVVLLSVLAFTAVPVLNAAENNFAAPMYVTPPAPIITDVERQTELAKRRAAVLSRMSPNSLMILRSAATRNYAGDVDFYYRQENNLYYLTALRQNNSTLVLTKAADGKTQEILFLPKRNPGQETWTGKMYASADAIRLSGLQTIVNANELPAFLQSVKDKKDFASKDNVKIGLSAMQNVYLLLPEDEGDGDGMAEFNRENDFAKSLANYTVVNAHTGKNDIFGDLRLVKSAYELKLLI